MLHYQGVASFLLKKSENEYYFVTWQHYSCNSIRGGETMSNKQNNKNQNKNQNTNQNNQNSNQSKQNTNQNSENNQSSQCR